MVNYANAFSQSESGKYFEWIIAHIEEDPFNVSKWCCQNYLLLNPDKTKLLVFGSRQKIAELGDFKISLLGKEPLPVPSGKDLGAILDSNLTYDDYTTKTVSSCFSRPAQINRVKYAFNKNILINIIYTLIVFSKLFERVGKYFYLTEMCASYNFVKIMHALLSAGPKSMIIFLLY